MGDQSRFGFVEVRSRLLDWFGRAIAFGFVEVRSRLSLWRCDRKSNIQDNVCKIASI
ncbi:MAG: hypothetical protein ACYTXA_12865 [Nostoc sp.]